MGERLPAGVEERAAAPLVDAVAEELVERDGLVPQLRAVLAEVGPV
ncbi:MAG: hypothetical protein M0Z42_14435 [Actinomycetota bacterium]|nr:hypothetical protein [Actinomycetota bacterium]